MAAESGLRVWSITTDGTTANLLSLLGYKFDTTYQGMSTKFKHPTQDYYIFIILDPCNMIKRARNALGSLGTFTDNSGNKIKWIYFKNLCAIQDKNTN